MIPARNRYWNRTHHAVFHVVVGSGDVGIELSRPEEDVSVHQGHLGPAKLTDLVG